MSLIQDALKRKREEEALRPPKETPLPAPPPPVEPEPSAPENKPKSSPDKIQLLLVFLIVVLLISLGATRLLKTHPTLEPVVEEPDVIVKKPAPPPPAPVVKEEPADTWPELKLTGFASVGGQQMVVINGRMLSMGGRIRGGRVIEIGEDYAVIDYQGEQRTIYSNE